MKCNFIAPMKVKQLENKINEVYIFLRLIVTKCRQILQKVSRS